ncbi:MAG: MFS transporter [Deferribacterales bacterium]
MKENSKAVKSIVAVNILCVAAMMSFLAVVGPIVRELGLMEWHAGLSVALGGVLWILTARFWGRKSDVKGRRPVLFTGIAGFAMSYFLLSLFISFAVKNPPSVIVSVILLMLTRGMIGAFYSAIPPVSAAVVADSTSPEKRASMMAVLGASNGIGMIVGPALGGALAVFGLAVPLFAAAVMPAMAAVVIYLFLKQSKPAHTEKTEPLKILDPRLRLPMTAAFLTMYSVVTSQVCLGFYVIDRLELDMVSSSKVTGFALSSIGFAFIAVQIAVSRISGVSPRNWLKTGAAVSALGYLAVTLFASTQVSLIIGFCVATAGMGMIFPAFQALAANAVSKSEQGAAAGTVSAAQGIGIITGPLLSTLFYGFDPSLPFLAASAAFGFLTLYAWKTRESVWLENMTAEERIN